MSVHPEGLHRNKPRNLLSSSPSDRPAVLVVDDNPANLLAFEAILESLPIRITLTRSGQEGLALLLKEEYAVILLDVRMPVMDGIETASVIRRGGRAQFTPIIFISAHDTTPFEVSEGYLAGAIDYLFSPVNPETLKRKVGAFVDLYQRNKQIRFELKELTRQNLLQKERIRELEGTVLALREDLARQSGFPPRVGG